MFENFLFFLFITFLCDTIIFLDLVLGIFFFMQTGAGLLGNFFLLRHRISSFLSGTRMRPVDYIFSHLALANSLGLISKGVPQTMVDLGLKIFLDRVGCRVTVFVHRVAHSLSVSITCLLSGYQVIIISPISSSIWSEVKTCTSKCVLPFCFFSWVLHILMNISMFVTMQNFTERSNNTKIWNIGFCSDYASTSFQVSLSVIMYCIHDLLCVGFMVMASGYLVHLLQRHHQQVQHIHSSSLLSRKSPEIKATYTILVLVSTYVSFYIINSIFSFYLFQFDKYQWLIPISALLDACFPTISPFVLIGSDSQIHHLFYSLWGKKKTQDSFP
ncbi:vomeronasal type-1 receptor 3-like [Trichosurus vulpecula]|uniref:vomeronasal type-1 receptor 3-like n=1 Tax=Trichosurus vulpecula TaxID=9337 RepID=UPI00186ADF78|nr:vomeronasal type-1 receptor 3-like [Trichosurus vulpecula]